MKCKEKRKFIEMYFTGNGIQKILSKLSRRQVKVLYPIIVAIVLNEDEPYEYKEEQNEQIGFYRT